MRNNNLNFNIQFRQIKIYRSHTQLGTLIDTYQRFPFKTYLSWDS